MSISKLFLAFIVLFHVAAVDGSTRSSRSTTVRGDRSGRRNQSTMRLRRRELMMDQSSVTGKKEGMTTGKKGVKMPGKGKGSGSSSSKSSSDGENENGVDDPSLDYWGTAPSAVADSIDERPIKKKKSATTPKHMMSKLSTKSSASSSKSRTTKNSKMGGIAVSSDEEESTPSISDDIPLPPSPSPMGVTASPTFQNDMVTIPPSFSPIDDEKLDVTTNAPTSRATNSDEIITVAPTVVEALTSAPTFDPQAADPFLSPPPLVTESPSLTLPEQPFETEAPTFTNEETEEPNVQATIFPTAVSTEASGLEDEQVTISPTAVPTIVSTEALGPGDETPTTSPTTTSSSGFTGKEQLTMVPSASTSDTGPSSTTSNTGSPTMGTTSVDTAAQTEGNDFSSATPAPTGGSTPSVSGLEGPLTIESRLDVSFFETMPDLREPTQAELDSFFVQLRVFYTEILTREFPDVGAVQVNLIDVTFDEKATFQLQIDFDIQVFGVDTSAADEVVNLMSTADYDDFTQNYVWGQTEGIFMGTTRVEYSQRD